jgi:type 1 fimbria pilin
MDKENNITLNKVNMNNYNKIKEPTPSFQTTLENCPNKLNSIESFPIYNMI